MARAQDLSSGEGRTFRPDEKLVIWVVWLTYGSFYFCRTNIAVAVPGLEEDLGLSLKQIAWILGSLKLTYGLGQFINGQLAERVSPRRLLAIGMLGSAVLTIVFGLSTGFYFLLFVWACNGYCQALGWTPCMRVTANWFPPRRRGEAIGLIGTGYQATAAATFVLAGWSAETLGWQGALYVPAGVLLASCLHMLLFLREKPGEQTGRREGAGEDGASATEPHGTAEETSAHAPFIENVIVTLNNPSLWFLAVALGLLNACRYGFLDWGMTHLFEVQSEGIGKAGVKYMLLPLGGIPGAYIAGWATDRFFGGRRAPVICILLVLLGVLTILYNSAVHAGPIATMCSLVLVGFTIYGPQVLLVGTAPVDLARQGTPAAAVGFVNFMGYMGAFAGDQVTGILTQSYDWEVAVGFWACCAFAAAGSVALLWNTTRGPAEGAG